MLKLITKQPQAVPSSTPIIGTIFRDGDKKGLNIYEGKVNDAKSGFNILIIASIHSTFSILKTAYKH